MKILIELFIVWLIAYGIWNEEKLVDFEDKLLFVAKRIFKKTYRKLYGRYIEWIRKSLKENF